MPTRYRDFVIAVLNWQRGEKHMIIQIVMDLEFFLARYSR